MANRMPIDRGKRRTREHVIAELGANHLERHALHCGFAVERLVRDYGLDLVLWTFTPEGEIETNPIWIQMKATDAVETVRKGEALVCRVRQNDLRRWAGEVLPVILILYDAQGDAAYRLCIQEYWEAQQLTRPRRLAAHVSLRVPRANVVDANAIRRFVVLRDRMLAHAKREARPDV